MKDTWAEIKRKMDKLIESDGVCVVCFDKEISECEEGCSKACKCKIKFIPAKDCLYCLDCCELLCLKCFENMTTVKCPVCRVRLGKSYERYYELTDKNINRSP